MSDQIDYGKLIPWLLGNVKGGWGITTPANRKTATIRIKNKEERERYQGLLNGGAFKP